MKEVKFSSLNESQKNLIAEAEKVMNTAYNPYSNFFVGAALLSTTGEIIGGSNVENAAYGSVICAERAAILKANSVGIRKFSKLAIIARAGTSNTKEVTAPCGACRQNLFELTQLSGKDMEIILSTTNHDKIVLTSISELLPLAFGPEDLGVDIKKYQNPLKGGK